MTSPLTPPGCDLRGLGFMPLDVNRLLDSDTVALTDGREFKAAFMLWARSWTQVPAASVPDDERLLCRMAGVALTEWREIAAMALRGWVSCDDGRLYHPVVAEKALRAWIERIGFKDRSAKAQAGRHESFKYRAEDFALMKRDAAICLERLIPGSAAEVGVLLEGAEKLPPRSVQPPSRTPSRSDLGSEEKGERRDSEGREKGEDTSLVVSPSEPTPAQQAFAGYLDLADDLGLAKPRKLDADRAAKLAHRVAEHGGLEGWAEILNIVRRSPHLQGRNDRGWKVTFDWMLQPANLRKIAEGNYLRDDSTPSPSGGGYMALAMEGAPH